MKKNKDEIKQMDKPQIIKVNDNHYMVSQLDSSIDEPKEQDKYIVNPKISTIHNEPEKKRVYINITMDHYLFAKKKTGASLGTLQDYFDALIEYDRIHHIISYGEE